MHTQCWPIVFNGIGSASMAVAKIPTRTTKDIWPMLGLCQASVEDGGPALTPKALSDLITCSACALEAVCRYRDPQLQVGNSYAYFSYTYLFILRPNMSKSYYLNTHYIPYINSDLTC